MSVSCLADLPHSVTKTAWWDHLKCSGLFQSLSTAWHSSRRISLLPQPVSLDGGPVLVGCLVTDWVTDEAAARCWPFLHWLFIPERLFYRCDLPSIESCTIGEIMVQLGTNHTNKLTALPPAQRRVTKWHLQRVFTWAHIEIDSLHLQSVRCVLKFVYQLFWQ